MFKKRAKKVTGEGAAAQEREEFPGWNEASQEVRDWWISLEALNQSDSEFRNAVQNFRSGKETITGLWEVWTYQNNALGHPSPERHPENLRTDLWSLLAKASKTRRRREEAEFAAQLDADLDRILREELGRDEAGEHARNWWELFQPSAFLDPVGFINTTRVVAFLQELRVRKASITEAYLAWVHTEAGKSHASADPGTLLAYLDQHRDELRQEAAQGGDDVPIPKHPYLWKRERLRKGTDYYLDVIAEGASPEAMEWWREVEEKYQNKQFALFLLVREAASQGASLDKLHAAGTAAKWSTIEALQRVFEGRAVERPSLTSVEGPGTLGNVDPSKTHRTKIQTREGSELDALKAPAYLTEAERASLAAIAKLLEEHPRLASLVREKCDEVSPQDEFPSPQQAGTLSTERVIRTREAARILGIPQQNLKKLAQKGKIGALVDGQYVFSEIELHDYLKNPPRVGRSWESPARKS
jgi:hypothetical protein